MRNFLFILIFILSRNLNLLANLFEPRMLISLGVVNPTNLTNLSDLTSEFRETSIVLTRVFVMVWKITGATNYDAMTNVVG